MTPTREAQEGEGVARRRKGSCGRDGAAMGWTDKQDARKNKLFPSLQFPSASPSSLRKTH